MEWTVTGEVIEWRGPAPFHFLPMGEGDSADLKAEAAGLEYWGQVGVDVVIGRTAFRTAVFPKGGRYLVPLRTEVRRAEHLDVGVVTTATVRLAHDRPAATPTTG